jgi:hypothetical protein
MGKTSIVKKMVAEPKPGVIPIYRDLEKVREPLEFVQYVFDDVESYLSKRKRVAQHARGLLSQLTGLEIAGVVKIPSTVAPHWKNILDRTIDDLAQNQDERIVFFWDEMPLMLYNIRRRGGEGQAAEILDTLRSLRQTYDNIRMVYTGSVGLHHVITGLRQEESYVNDPTNDMSAIDVPPLERVDAEELADQLLKGEGLAVANADIVAAAIARQVDNLPFFIHHVVDQMTMYGGPIDSDTAEAIVEAHLVEAQDPWHLRYYRERLDEYYAPGARPVALALLDTLAVSERPLTFDDLYNLLQARMPVDDADMVRGVLTLLQQDHYVAQEPRSAVYRFRFPLIQRYWRMQRGLA